MTIGMKTFCRNLFAQGLALIKSGPIEGILLFHLLGVLFFLGVRNRFEIA